MSLKSAKKWRSNFFARRGPGIPTPSVDCTKLPSSNLIEPQILPNRPVSDVLWTSSGPEPHQPINASTVQETLNHSSSNPTQADTPPLIVPEEPQLTTKPTGQTPGLSASQRLWNAAYDSLEEDDDTAALVTSYVKILTGVLAEGDTGVSTSGADVSIELHEPTKRQAHMRMLVDAGRNKVATSSKITKRVGDVIEYIQKAKGMVDIAIQNTPQAALPWAGVCIGLQILSNPPMATKSQLIGIAHVVSRMNWYCALSEDLLDKDHIVTRNRSLEAVLEQLEKTVLELYKALLLYQMKSVCSYYRNQGVVFLRGLISVDDWDGDLKNVRDAEAIVQNDSAQYIREQTKTSLGKLVELAERMETQLRDIHQDLRDFIDLQKEMRMDDKSTECLRSLRVVDPQDDIKRIEGEKDELFDEAYRWIFLRKEYTAFTNWDEPDSPRLLWIKGLPGTGKTMLLMGIIRELESQLSLLTPSLAYFFCQGTGDQSLAKATAALRSLMWLLLLQQPQLLSHLLSRYEKAGPPFFSDRNVFHALSSVFRSMLKDPLLSPTYLIVDALDEFNEGMTEFIDLISTSLTLSNKVRWLVSSRPDVKLKNPDTSRSLVELDPSVLEDPVNKYIDHKLSTLRGNDRYDEDTLANVSNILRQRAMNTFLWVALVFKELDAEAECDVIDVIGSIPPGLSKLYGHIMTRIERQQRKDPEYCKNALVASSLAHRPLTLAELKVLADLPSNVDPQRIVNKCGSFLTITEQTVSLIHGSAKDYLVRESTIFPSGHADAHRALVRSSLESMSKYLQRDIYNLRHPGLSIGEVQCPDPDPLAPIRYACVYWVDHMCLSESGSDNGIDGLSYAEYFTDQGRVHQFLLQHLLHWFEALSLLGEIDKGILGLYSLEDTLAKSPSQNILHQKDLVHDAIRVLRQSRTAVEEAPLQVYCSALIFSPEESVVRQTFKQDVLRWISPIPSVSNNWNFHLQTLEGHGGYVFSVRYSPDGKQLASQSDDGTVRLWDTTTGKCLYTLEGHNPVVFSPNGQHLVSDTWDGPLQLVEATTGECLQILKNHKRGACSVAFSPDGRQLALVSNDYRVWLWDMTTEKYLYTLDGCNSVAFSPNGQQLASDTYGHTIRLWDATTRECLRTLKSRCMVSLLIFSPDGQRLISGSFHSVQLWNITTGECLETLLGERAEVNALAFSPDGQQLASISYEGTVHLWDAMTGKYLKSIEGHGGIHLSVAFSPNKQQLVSGSGDGILRLWDVTKAECLLALEGHRDPVDSVAFSPDGQRLASGSRDCTIRLWNATTQKQTLEGYGDSISSLAFSPDGMRLASGSADGTVRLRDATTGECSHTLKGHTTLVYSVAFSSDGGVLDSRSGRASVRIWDTTNGELLLMPDSPWEIIEVEMLTNLDHDGSNLLSRDSPQWGRYGMRDKNAWVTLDGRKALWLPPDYRPTELAIRDDRVGIGCKSGLVFILNFVRKSFVL
ncbi:hypothetical protein PV08_03925 [Exophiala spinifera]|uniref:NACHT domain-containing protein n=1 Tax=Exophiala spinifera TaxID=91928 RepID=A0A0D1YNQ2_9EURO|nr:uncharacterized protein PV08_03925 [Exophiala spinifera]KIW16736.1 hypothetical protein PV08_03925 [Exophiala spinifera]